MAAASAQRNMMRYPVPQMKRSPSMMGGYNQPMMGSSPMTPDTTSPQFGPFVPGVVKNNPFSPQYQSPGYNGGFGHTMPGTMNMNNMGMGTSMTGNMGMPPQYNSINNLNNVMGNMMGQQAPDSIQPVLTQRRPSTLQYPPASAAHSPNNRYI